MRAYKKVISLLLVTLLLLCMSVNAFAANNTTITVNIPCTVSMQIGDHGKVSVDSTDYTGNSSFQKAVGAAVTYTFQPSALYAIDKVIYDGTDVTAQLSGKTYTAPALDGNKTLQVSFRFLGIGEDTTYTVTFHANGHGTAPAAQAVIEGNKASEPPAPTADGYTFGGWYKNAACTEKYNFSAAVTGDLDLYAKWTNSSGGGSYTPSTYPIWIGGTQVSEDTLSGENWSYDPAAKIITLTGSVLTQHNGYAIYSELGEALNIVLDGTGSFTIDGIYNMVPSPYGVYDLNISAASGKTPDFVLTNTNAGKYPINVKKTTINGVRNLTANTAPAAALGLFGAELDIVASGNVQISNPKNYITKAANISAGSITLTGGGSGGSGGGVGVMFAGSASDTVTLSATGDITLTNTTGLIATSNLTITKAANVTIEGNKTGYLVEQNLSIQASGDVELENESGYIVGNNANISGRNIRAVGNHANALLSRPATLSASGDITLTNKSGKISYTDLTITKAENVAIEGNAANTYLIDQSLSIQASGDVKLENKSGYIVGNSSSISGRNIRAAGNGSYYLLSQPATLSASGNVELTNSNGSIALDDLTVSKATDITISGNTVGKLLVEGKLSLNAKGAVKLINSKDGSGNNITGSELCVKSTNQTLGSGTSAIVNVSYSNAAVTVSENADGSHGKSWDGTDPSSYKYLEVKRSSTSGGGGGGSSAPSTYAITVETSKHGEVTSSKKSAAKGETITLTVDPDKGYTLETLTAVDKNGKEIKLTAKNGKFTFKMPSSKVTVKATFMEDNTMLNYFVDVPSDAYYYDAVLWAAEQKITLGADAVHFAPNGVCTRAQAVTFLWRAAGEPVVNYAMPFTDVPADAYYAEAVRWAVSEGVTVGTSATTFSPNATCTRAQIVSFIYRANKVDTLNIKDNPFTDVAEGSYYYDAVLWASANGVTGGTSATTFSPNDNCTRAQIVTFLYRYFVK